MASSDAHRAAAPSSPSPSQLLTSADKALAFLRSATQPPVWPPAKPDIAYVFKLPAAYESMGCVEEGRAVFAELLRPHLPDGGVHSDNPAYRFAYPHYPWMWASYAAAKLGLTEDAALCDRLLSPWQAGDGSGLVRNPNGVECDLFSTALQVWNHLVNFGRVLDARRAGTALVRAVNRWSNEYGENANVLPLRWDAASLQWLEPHHCEADPTCASSLFYSVSATQRNDKESQLYFMVAFPAITLELLAAASSPVKPDASLPTSPSPSSANAESGSPSSGDESLRDYFHQAACRLVQFLSRAAGAASEPTGIGKVAYAAVLVGDDELASRVLNNILASQNCDGSFFGPTTEELASGPTPRGDVELEDRRMEAMREMDQTAEMVVWLSLIAAHRTASQRS